MLFPVNKDTVGALVLFAAGGFVATVAAGYPLEAYGRIGPGLFPVALGLVLCALALVLFAAGLSRPAERIEIAWRSAAAILGAVVVFLLAMPSVGLVPAVCAMVLTAAAAEPGRRFWPTLALAASVAALISAVFVAGLKMPIALFTLPF